MTMDLYDNFLEQITDECFSSGVQERNLREKIFLKLRFHPNNNGDNFKQHIEIAGLMEKTPGLEGDCKKAINTTCQNVVRTIARQYESEITGDGIEVASLVNGKRGQKGAWEKVYNWLSKQKFPRWRTDFIWHTWQKKAQSRRDWLSFGESNAQRGMVVPIPPSSKIKTNKPLIMQIELEHSESYLLLLNRGKYQQNKETKYLVCPSQAFAPKPEPVANLRYLPQSGAICQEIQFDAAGKEEYIGIIVDKIPENIAWLNPNPQEPAPHWDESRIFELWQQLETQQSYQVFFQSFEIVSKLN